MIQKIKLIFFLLILLPKSTFAIETLGGEITWKCAGGNNFIFELVLYRDCNSADITDLSENIRVWNHTNVTDINVNFISRTTISPICTQNNGSLPPLNCGSGNNGGNGLGAVEKFIFRSNPISLAGVPPAEGWIFTYITTSRKSTISNLVNPASNGMTLVAKMFEVNEVQNTCLDNSPQFLENPYLIVCSGSPYVYMPNISDIDLDSLSFKMADPLNSFTSGSFNPPTNPIQASFAPNFSASSPTPGVIINGSNTGFYLNSQSGDISFTSVIPGEYVFKFIVESYRNGKKIAEVEREMVVFVVACNGNNTQPTINAPVELSNLFEASFTAGSLANFTVTSTDLEFLQDGTSPQQNFMTISSKALPNTLSVNGIQGSSLNVNWQTDCSDLKNAFGNEFPDVTYDFVIKVQDDYCQIPKTSYQRIKIHLTTNISIEPSQIQCIQTLPNGDLEITWSQVANPANDFVAYELHSVQNGLLGTYNSISTTSAVFAPINDDHDFFIKTISGTPCSIAISSDTVSNIFLQIFNPGDGIATLSWNQPVAENTNEIGDFYQIYREYPAFSSNWTLVGTVPFGSNQFKDTIDVCEAFLNYKVILPTINCDFTSNVVGDNFEDQISPDIPIISSVSIDTLTGLTIITWNQNSQPDTYGYIIYSSSVGGVLTEIDTVFGINNTSYSFLSTANVTPLTFSVAAFDSCFTDLFPVTYQTSAKANIHTSVHLTHKYDICTKTVRLEWTNYVGWQAIENFEIFGHKQGFPWQSYGTTDDLFFEIPLDEFFNYEFVVQAKESSSINTAFSNKIDFYTISSSKPSFNYTKVASVTDNLVEIKHYVDAVTGITALALERMNENGEFVEIQRLAVSQNVTFLDEDVDVSEKSYRYQVRIIDSCGNPSVTANQVKTILLKVVPNNNNFTNFLSWNAYEGFNGSILYYNVYRGVNGVLESTPFQTVASNQLFCEDTINVTNSNFNGKICYYVDAVESFNIYGFRETSHSNVACSVFEPIVYIPNSFSPNGDQFNQTFKPIVSLVEISDYVFTVIDRWGQVIFQTNDVNEGWNGDISQSNQSAPLGTYAYVVQLKDGNQQEIIRRGQLTLLR